MMKKILPVLVFALKMLVASSAACDRIGCEGERFLREKRAATSICPPYLEFDRSRGYCRELCQAVNCASLRCENDFDCVPFDTLDSIEKVGDADEVVQKYGSKAPKPKSKCFHGSTQLQLLDGSTKRIDEVQVGDRVASVNEEGNLDYVDIVYLPHLENKDIATFIEIACETEDGMQTSIKLTEDHFLYTRGMSTDTFSSAAVVIAADVEEGDEIWFLGESVVAEVCLVTSTYTHVANGVYSAFSSNGRLVANGIVASSYAGRTTGLVDYSHNMAHWGTLAHRVVYHLRGTSSDWFRYLNDNILAPLFA